MSFCLLLGNQYDTFSFYSSTNASYSRISLNFSHYCYSLSINLNALSWQKNLVSILQHLHSSFAFASIYWQCFYYCLKQTSSYYVFQLVLFSLIQFPSLEIQFVIFCSTVYFTIMLVVGRRQTARFPCQALSNFNTPANKSYQLIFISLYQVHMCNLIIGQLNLSNVQQPIFCLLNYQILLFQNLRDQELTMIFQKMFIILLQYPFTEMLKTLEGKAHETNVSKTVIKEMRQTFYQSAIIPEEQIPDLWPKKGKVIAFKTKSGDDRKSQHFVIDNQIHFIHIEGFVVPTLKTVHAYPNLYPKFMADTGAAKFILKGANVMSPGLLNQQSHMDDVKQGAIVAIYIHGHEHAVAIGVTKKSTQQIRNQKEGIAVETIHYVGDGFWSMLYKK